MSHWDEGYISDIEYTHGYYKEMNPLHVNFALNCNGIEPPTFSTACELGFGQGISINMHSVSQDTKWWGTDFNSSQSGYAKDVAQSAGLSVELFDDSFDEFSRRTDLPKFDFIALHGIWSWISTTNRRVILDFVRNRLNIGGVVYIGYNTLPGWSDFVTVRHLLTQYCDKATTKNMPRVARIKYALDYAAALFDKKPLHGEINTRIKHKIEELQKTDPAYVAHEYFNKDWEPITFNQMSESMLAAKLDYACSGSFIDDIDMISLTEEQRLFLAEIHDRDLLESTKDLIANRPFRKDYWIRGIRKQNKAAQSSRLRNTSVCMLKDINQIKLEFDHLGKKVSLSSAIYEPILSAIAKTGIVTVGEIEQIVEGSSINLPQIVQAIQILISLDNLALTYPNDEISHSQSLATKLNNLLLKEAETPRCSKFLSSPISGGAVYVDRFEKLFILAIQEKLLAPKDIAHFVWDIMKQNGERIAVEGKELITEEDNLARLEENAKTFLDSKLNKLKLLRVV